MSQKITSKKTRHVYSIKEKLEAMELLREHSVPAVAEIIKTNPANVRRWKRDYEKLGEKGLVNQSSRPHHQPKKTSQWIIDTIKGLKKEKPELGVVAMSEHLSRFESVDLSANTISKIYKKESLPDGDAGYAEQSFRVKGDKDKRLEQSVETEIGEWERFARPNPNDLWQMDIMSFYIRDAHTVYLISALDDCSRMIVSWGLYRQQTAENVLEVLRTALACHGAPREILTDQGAQFKHWKGVTLFEKLLEKLKIHHIKARAHHPQTCGKIEAFHKTIQRELIDKEFFLSQEQAVERISRFIEHYNHARPHSALDGFTPADRYYGLINAVKRYITDTKQPKNEMEEKDEKIGVGRGSKVYLIGKVLGQDIRLQEIAGRLCIHLNNKPWHEINLLQ